MEPMKYMESLLKRYPKLEAAAPQIKEAYQMLEECYARGGKLLVAGNGGSCADSEHIVGELMKGFVKSRRVSEREKERLEEAGREMAGKLGEAEENLGSQLADCLQGGLKAIALTGHSGLSTAFLNDVNGDMIYAQQLWGYGDPGDVFLGISTSGNSKNILYAIAAAKAKGIRTIALTGRDGGKMGKLTDTAIIVPEEETYKIQELHLPVYHTLCLMLEERFFS